MTEPDDLHRLRQEYESRKVRLSGSHIYSYFYPPYLFEMQGLERQILRLMKANAEPCLEDQTILEVGCGSGGVLKQFSRWGACPRQIHGVDLLLDRLVEAREALSGEGIVNANGEWLPYPSGAFDLVMQFTAFSSILDDEVKRQVAGEMLRVVKPSGFILWYDFWLNPTNKQTRGIRPTEIRALFPGCRYEFKKITLAPPIARRLVPLSWNIAQVLESLKLFNTHYLVLIHKVG
jgi:ubiquinone/menaquinone biosynthesis C-methylase UbiE